MPSRQRGERFEQAERQVFPGMTHFPLRSLRGSGCRLQHQIGVTQVEFHGAAVPLRPGLGLGRTQGKRLQLQVLALRLLRIDDLGTDPEDSPQNPDRRQRDTHVRQCFQPPAARPRPLAGRIVSHLIGLAGRRLPWRRQWHRGDRRPPSRAGRKRLIPSGRLGRLAHLVGGIIPDQRHTGGCAPRAWHRRHRCRLPGRRLARPGHHRGDVGRCQRFGKSGSCSSGNESCTCRVDFCLAIASWAAQGTAKPVVIEGRAL